MRRVAGTAHQFRDGGTSCRRPGEARMAEVVKPEVVSADSRPGGSPRHAQRAVGASDDECIVIGADVGVEMHSQKCESIRRNGDCTPACARLRLLHDRPAGHGCGARDVDRDDTELKVDVSSTQPSHLPSAQLAPCGQHHRNLELRGHLCCQSIHLGHRCDRALRGPLYGGSTDLTRVLYDEAVRLCRSHDRRHQPVGLCRSRGTGAGYVREPPTDIRCANRRKRAGLERGEDVAGQQPCIELMGALSQVDPLIEPFLGVAAERTNCIDEDHRFRGEDISSSAGLCGPAIGRFLPYGQDVTPQGTQESADGPLLPIGCDPSSSIAEVANRSNLIHVRCPVATGLRTDALRQPCWHECRRCSHLIVRLRAAQHLHS